ncbi:DUF3307 domain-containing protein [Rhodanobacter sp. FW102-FHT14D06]|uniref:DUF3307 domain-containing protein n=2 Tax=unclassified Rhodanobacter TaxID=2621553 RepID=A0AB74USA9_9GAMM
MILFLLIAAHALADYPLQGDFLAANKARTGPNYVPWWQALLAHAFIHGGFVAVITGVWWLGALEVAIHAVTDHLKCESRIGINTDQAIHVACKLTWAAIALGLF